ncbi:unnamed protein product [Linum trigynum]|uniref:Uncharacterized protein n=1 Tax=Linum trigynum TaxID=586398 RepID=A0AAV2EQE7_9ROSI
MGDLNWAPSELPVGVPEQTADSFGTVILRGSSSTGANMSYFSWNPIGVEAEIRVSIDLLIRRMMLSTIEEEQTQAWNNFYGDSRSGQYYSHREMALAPPPLPLSFL